MKFNLPLIGLLIFPLELLALEEMADDSLGEVTGQNGVYISGELNFNEDGGPLIVGDSGNVDPDGAGAMQATWGSCTQKAAGTVERCGARLAVEMNDSGGWVAYDELQGSLSFEGLTLRSRDIDSATDNFGGDEVAANGKTVLEIGLPNEVKFKDFSYNVVTSSQGRPTDAGFSQQVRYGVDFNGTVNLKGNLLVFPTGTP
jgi:hypothetical protein